MVTVLPIILVAIVYLTLANGSTIALYVVRVTLVWFANCMLLVMQMVVLL